MTSNRRISILAVAAALIGGPALADDVVTVGLIVPMTGQSATTGKQEQAGANLYIQLHGDTVAGKKIVLEVKDDAGAPDVTKRLAQDLIANDNAKALMGFGLTPLALAVAPVATEAKVPEIVTAAATAMITEKSPYIVRTSFTLPQAAAPMAQWCAEERHPQSRDRWSPTTALATTPRSGSATCSRRAAARSSRGSARRSRPPTSRRSCSG